MIDNTPLVGVNKSGFLELPNVVKQDAIHAPSKHRGLVGDIILDSAYGDADISTEAEPSRLPEERMQIGLLHRAIKDFHFLDTGCGKDAGMQQHLHREARLWFEDRRKPTLAFFTFVDVCEVIGSDPDYLYGCIKSDEFLEDYKKAFPNPSRT